MSKLSKTMKKLGFTFSFKRLKKAILLVILFSIIGIGVYALYEFKASETGLKMIYEKEVSSKIEIGENTIIRIYKKDINDDKALDFVFIMGKEKRSSDDALNSTIERYDNVSLVIIDGKTDDVKKYNTEKSFEPEVTLKIVEDEKNRYFLISDYNGNINLFRLNKENLVEIIKNTTIQDFLGYTIYTKKDEENKNILEVSLDNYDKNYLKEYKDIKRLDFTQASVDLSKYRETYLRDKISKFEFKDTNNDGILEFVTTQYILYSLDENATTNKTIGKIEVYFNIKDNKLNFDRVEINI